MGGHKHGSRSGGYVGSFLQMFDWNAKSKKKLFLSKTDSPESNQGKKSKDGFLEKDEEFGERLGNDYSCASSVTDDDVYGVKAPSVVARLMGLDSLPASNILEPYATPFLETRSLRDTSFRRKDRDLYEDDQIVHTRNLIDKAGGSPPRKTLDSRPRKMPPRIDNRPIEKFQTEILPPRSAKTIPITHHKLLSPIKSPIFVPSKDAARIMEAAAKIIEPGTKDTPRKRISSTGSSSITFKVREMREKLEAVQRTSVESKAVKVGNGSVDDSWCAERSKGKSGKSISLAIQAKVNVKKREGLTPRSRSLERQEEQPEAPTTMNRKSTALRQNNLKQNCSTYREKYSSTGKMAVSSDGISNRRQKRSVGDSGTGNYRTTSRKSSLQARDSGGDKDFPYPGARNVPRKKRSIDSSTLNRNQVTNKCDTASDVISFTFSAPITRSLPGSEPNRRLKEIRGNLFQDDGGKKIAGSDYTMLSLPGLNGLGSDSLSFMLEKKLKELMSNFETPSRDFNVGRDDDSEESTAPAKANEKENKHEELRVNDMKSDIYHSLSSNKPEQLNWKHSFQTVEALDEYNGIKTDNKQWNDRHLPSPVSVLETSMLTESCNSPESLASSSSEESKPCSSIQAHQFLGSNSLKKRQTKETETDTSDSASSTSSQISSSKDPMKPTSWELVYIQDVLCNMEFNTFQMYTTGETHKIVNQNLFNQMERRQQGGLKIEEDAYRLERKVLFNCISECLDLKCQCSIVVGGFEMWAKGIAALKRKERLGEEVYKEIQGWRSLGKSMVDELVDKDMSSKYGRWIDFEVDEFMVGVEIEAQILDSLLLEMVADQYMAM